MTPFQVNRLLYGANPFFESLEIAKFIEENTNSDDNIAILGSEPQIYFYSKRHSTSGFLYMYPMMENHKFALIMQQNYIANIEKKLPKYIVYVNVVTSWLRTSESNNLLYNYSIKLINKNYKLVGMVEIFMDESYFNWNPQKINFLALPRYWVSIFELNAPPSSKDIAGRPEGSILN